MAPTRARGNLGARRVIECSRSACAPKRTRSFNGTVSRIELAPAGGVVMSATMHETVPALRGVALAAGLLLAACSADDSGGTPCASGSDHCGETCSELRPCAYGLHCTDGVCAQDCKVGTRQGCESGELCNSVGMCVANDEDDDGFGNPTGSAGSSTGRPGSGGGNRDGSAGECADTTVRANKLIPTVILIVDQSSSMDEDFADGTRWDVLRGFLLQQPGGLIDDLQSQVRFGLAMYSARSGEDDPAPVGECPIVTTVAPMLDNYPAISAAYEPAEPIDDTPTGDSINKVIDDLDLGNDPDAMPGATVFVLATDGEPDRCEELDPQTEEAKNEAIGAVQRAYGLGIRTFIISVGEGTVSAEHQQAMANAGLGLDPMMGSAEYWVAGDDRTLRDALISIVGGQVGCDIALNGRVASGDACLGTVTLNGEPLECDDPNGWELIDDQHIRLSGRACDDLKNMDDVLLDVSFPCSVGVVF